MQIPTHRLLVPMLLRMILFIGVGWALGFGLGYLVRPTPTSTPNYVRDNHEVDESDANLQAVAAAARNDVASIADREAWHEANDAQALQGLGRLKGRLHLRTLAILDRGTREAGLQFLSAIVAQHGRGETVYTLERGAIVGIDQDKLKRWATIALVVLQLAEPFVPPPYNLGVHMAVILLKLYLDQPLTPQPILPGPLLPIPPLSPTQGK